ncbi:hypothetical protein [Synechococcus sp. GFB01]|uniref:hypothetical protein n=1 Tax=Synechococcus sp. GFB01 TaxID=1662190 RepID=UPI00064E3CBC|nr:hypothetical protein [Synechococcus sp. GFB01]KMM17714.1 hypothetical protein SYNGFB01_02125 [Synechococcus sp. GFB01]
MSSRVALGCLLLLLSAAAPSRAGSVTAESVWDRDNALQRARQQLPRGAVVGRERCQIVEVGRGNDRYRCTIDYSMPPAGTKPPTGVTDGSSAPAP